MTEPTHAVSVREATETCLGAMRSTESVQRAGPTIERFVKFCEGEKVASLPAIQPSDVESFVNSRLESGLPSGVSTRHNRRSALRLLFRLARRQGLIDSDPTIDVALPPRTSLPTRPLTDGEIELCRDIAWWTSSRFAATWALAEATARGAELGAICVTDVDVCDRKVWIHGGSRTVPRNGSLTEWGIHALERRLVEVHDGPLVYQGSSIGNARQVATCRAIGIVLLRAGLAAEHDVRPSSVSAWVGRREFLKAGRIEDAASAMGVRSLDRAARLIGQVGN
jgi:integrase/recombinase XerC